MRTRHTYAYLALLPAIAVVASATPAAAGTTCKNLWCSSSEDWKDSGFGASYDFWSGIETKADHAKDNAYDSTYLQTGAALNISAKVLGKRVDIADVSALAYNNRGVTTGGVDVVLAGTVLVSEGIENTISYGFDRTFFKASDSIKLLGVKISLSGKVTGGLGIDVTPSLQNNAIVLEATPFTHAYASVDASVGASCAKVKVSGNATAIELELPTSLSASIASNGKLSYAVGSGYALQAINGKIKVKLDYCARSDSKTIAKFSGIRSSKVLMSTSGTLSL